MHESHPCMLCHGVAAVPAVYCGAGYGRAVLVGAHGRPCTVRRGAVGRVRVGGSAGPHRRRRACQKRLVFSAFAPFLGADRACLFSKLHGDQRHGLDGDIFQGCGHPLGPGGPDDRYGHLGRNAGRASVHRICFPGKKQLPHPFADVRMLRRHLYPASRGKNGGRRMQNAPPPARAGGALLYSWKERCGVHTLPPCGRGSVPK